MSVPGRNERFSNSVCNGEFDAVEVSLSCPLTEGTLHRLHRSAVTIPGVKYVCLKGILSVY